MRVNKFSPKKTVFAEGSITHLQTARKSRIRKILKDLVPANVGAVIGAGAAIMISPRETRVKIQTAIGALIGVNTASIIRSNVEVNRQIKSATKTVGNLLRQEIKQQKNPALLDFLKQHKYIYVDKEGNLVGTNKDRIQANIKIKGKKVTLAALGRIRIETKSILN